MKVALRDLLRSRYPEMDRDEAFALIACGDVRVAGEVVRDGSRMVPDDAVLEVKGRAAPYVSRAGAKLEHALHRFGVDVSGKCIVDAGASTGGFTDCLLAHGARCVHAIDVGYNQLDYTLRRDERVVVHERTNIMTVTAATLDPAPEAAVADLSFRSLHGIARHLVDLVSEKWAIVLVKPQFELRDPPADFDGVVRDRRQLRKILIDVWERLETEGVAVTDCVASPVAGRKGNREFLFLISPAIQTPEADRATTASAGEPPSARIERSVDALLYENESRPSGWPT